MAWSFQLLLTCIVLFISASEVIHILNLTPQLWYFDINYNGSGIL